MCPLPEDFRTVGALNGLTGELRASIAQSVRQLDEDSRQKIWRNGMKKAGGGPGDLA